MHQDFFSKHYSGGHRKHKNEPSLSVFS